MEKPPNFNTKVWWWMEFSMEKWLQSAKEFGTVKVWCWILGMLNVLTKIWHQIFMDPTISRKEFEPQLYMFFKYSRNLVLEIS